MLIQEMTREENVARNRLGRLAWAREKIEWMRINPLVCVEAEELESADKWENRDRVRPI